MNWVCEEKRGRVEGARERKTERKNERQRETLFLCYHCHLLVHSDRFSLLCPSMLRQAEWWRQSSSTVMNANKATRVCVSVCVWWGVSSAFSECLLDVSSPNWSTNICFRVFFRIFRECQIGMLIRCSRIKHRGDWARSASKRDADACMFHHKAVCACFLRALQIAHQLAVAQ